MSRALSTCSVRALPNRTISTGTRPRRIGAHLPSSTTTTNRDADCRDDLLAHHRPSPSLDQPQCRVDAIRAVDRDVEAVSSQFLDRHAVLRRKRGTRKRGRDGADPQALPYAFRKPQDEPVRSRARAETHAHAVRHQRHCGFSRSAAGRLDVHPCRVAVRMPGVCSALPPWCGPAARAAIRRAVA